MIDLPIASEDNEVDLNSRILLYNHLLAAISFLILIISLYYIFGILAGSVMIGAIQNFIIVVLILLALTQLIDIYSWYLIQKQMESSLEKASKIYLIPVIFDIILVFAFGLGIIAIFLRVVVWGNINPDDPYFDEGDPLFN